MISCNSYSVSGCFWSARGDLLSKLAGLRKTIAFENASYVSAHISWYNKNRFGICLTWLFKKGEMCKEVQSIYRILGKNGRKTKWSHYNLLLFKLCPILCKKRSLHGILLQMNVHDFEMSFFFFICITSFLHFLLFFPVSSFPTGFTAHRHIEWNVLARWSLCHMCQAYTAE